MFSNLISFTLWICSTVFLWLVFEKANVKGWKALIPFYNMYCVCEIGNRKDYFIKYMVLSCITFVVTFVATILLVISIAFLEDNTQSAEYIFGVSALCISVLLFILLIVFGIFYLIISYKIFEGLALSFNQEKAFAFGLLFLTTIFYGIIAFSSNIIYVGKTEIENDPDAVNDKFTNPIEYGKHSKNNVTLKKEEDSIEND